MFWQVVALGPGACPDGDRQPGPLLGDHRAPGLPSHPPVQRPAGAAGGQMVFLRVLPGPHPAAVGVPGDGFWRIGGLCYG